MAEQTFSVVVVDDSDAIRKAIARFFTHKRWRVTTAVNGVEGLEALRRQPFDAVIRDVNMPERGGLWLWDQAPAGAARPVHADQFRAAARLAQHGSVYRLRTLSHKALVAQDALGRRIGHHQRSKQPNGRVAWSRGSSPPLAARNWCRGGNGSSGRVVDLEPRPKAHGLPARAVEARQRIICETTRLDTNSLGGVGGIGGGISAAGSYATADGKRS